MITSIHNGKVKYVMDLNRKARFRRDEKVYLVEGPKMVGEIAKEELVSVFVSEHYCSECNRRNEPIPFEKEAEIVSDPVFEQMSDTQSPQGVLAVVKQKDYTLEQILGEESRTPLLMILENLQDPGNLGTILRTAEGAGVTGVIMNRGCVDIYNSKVIRATMGAMFRVPFVYVDDLSTVMTELKNRGICTYAAHLAAEQSYDRADFTAPSAFLIGNESKGLSEQLTMQAEVKIIIPMLGKVESLNAAIAASILGFEAARQRRQ